MLESFKKLVNSKEPITGTHDLRCVLRSEGICDDDEAATGIIVVLWGMLMQENKSSSHPIKPEFEFCCDMDKNVTKSYYIKMKWGNKEIGVVYLEPVLVEGTKFITFVVKR